MIPAWVWIVASFGFLLSVRGTRVSLKGFSLVLFWRDALDLFLTFLLVVTVCDTLLLWPETSLPVTELIFPVVWVLAYLMGRYQGKSDIFFITVAVIVHSVLFVAGDLLLQMSYLLVITAGIFLFQVAFRGFVCAMRFSTVPKEMKGWPFFCLLAFCITVTMSAFFKLIF